jgi:hypothetical protein
VGFDPGTGTVGIEPIVGSCNDENTQKVESEYEKPKEKGCAPGRTSVYVFRCL